MTEGKLIHQHIVLPDGRRLGYAEAGDNQGEAVFYFHGWPGSRLEILLAEEHARRTGVHLIGVDRPGIGLSDFLPGRKIIDWAEDIRLLAEALEIRRFIVLGMSGGAPYALACAYRLPNQVKACGLLSGLGPYGMPNGGGYLYVRAVFWLCRYLPWLMDWGLRQVVANHWQHPEVVSRRLNRILLFQPKADRVLLRDANFRMTYVRSLCEAFRHGTRGVIYDGGLYLRSWGFALEQITVPVLLWHGKQDDKVPLRMAQAVAQRIPHCLSTFFPDDAHVSTAVNHMDDIITAIQDTI